MDDSRRLAEMILRLADDDAELALRAACPRCGADPGKPCFKVDTDSAETRPTPHWHRFDEVQAVLGEQLAEAVLARFPAPRAPAAAPVPACAAPTCFEEVGQRGDFCATHRPPSPRPRPRPTRSLTMDDRATYVPLPQLHALNMACRLLVDAFGWHVYHVGSSTMRRDYRDVDVRCLLPDEEFDRMFPGAHALGEQRQDARLLVLNLAVSAYLDRASGLPVDFQFQRVTQANEKFGSGRRSALGVQRWERTREVDLFPSSAPPRARSRGGAALHGLRAPRARALGGRMQVGLRLGALPGRLARAAWRGWTARSAPEHDEAGMGAAGRGAP